MTISLRNKSIVLLFALLLVNCKNTKENKLDVDQKNMPEAKATTFAKGTFGFDKTFLKEHLNNTVVLENTTEKSGIIISPELQGRVMTSSLNGDAGMSFGWINHDLIASKKMNEQFNAFGGEERFWLGPEGGQFSLYFPKDASFDFKNWKVPVVIDAEPFEIKEQTANSAVFEKTTALTNYSGTKFSMDITRTVSLLSKQDIAKILGLNATGFSAVAYETKNKVANTGTNIWTEKSGGVSIWLLCMFNPSPEVTVVAPINQGDTLELGVPVNDNYFGKISEDRLKATEQAIFFKADGKSRGKIGITPQRATKYIGSYDAENKVLTILEIDQPKATDKYVNSAWEIQDNPFSGDVINSYNDGPLESGDQLGPFYELESSSPALLLKPKESYTHTQRMYHFSGDRAMLDTIAKSC